MDDSEAEAEASFSVLPARLKRRIDRAFDNALAPDAGPPRKKPKLTAGGFLAEDTEPTPGGFIAEDTPAGGFLPPGSDDVAQTGTRTPESSEDEDTPSHVAHTHIPLTLIPTALQLLDLQPDDEDVLDVFRNAAMGWEGVRGASASQATLRVSRKDWRAVCAALLDTSAGDDEDADDHDGDTMEAEEAAEESDGDSEDYVDANSDGSDDASSGDEYQAGGFTRPKRRSAATTRSSGRKQSQVASSAGESDSDFDVGKTQRITPRQRQECRRAFALFFPDVPDEKLDIQKIMIKDISRVASLLKEKITAEEVCPSVIRQNSHFLHYQIIEMLEVFSTSPDKSMSLSDFEKMMIVAKLA